MGRAGNISCHLGITPMTTKTEDVSNVIIAVLGLFRSRRARIYSIKNVPRGKLM